VPHTLASLGTAGRSRVVQLSYSINVDGLGVQDSDDAFDVELFG
jgi:hypothetical protein